MKPTAAVAYTGIANHIHGFYNPSRYHPALAHLSPDDYARPLHAAEAGLSTTAL